MRQPSRLRTAQDAGRGTRTFARLTRESGYENPLANCSVPEVFCRPTNGRRRFRATCGGKETKTKGETMNEKLIRQLRALPHREAMDEEPSTVCCDAADTIERQTKKIAAYEKIQATESDISKELMGRAEYAEIGRRKQSATIERLAGENDQLRIQLAIARDEAHDLLVRENEAIKASSDTEEGNDENK